MRGKTLVEAHGYQLKIPLPEWANSQQAVGYGAPKVLQTIKAVVTIAY